MSTRHIATQRRTFLLAGAAAATEMRGEGAIPESFPSHPPALAREMVGVSHGNLARVRELLGIRPALANASWEWGFGDWETALGAASHVGRREIAELLIENGAAPTLFSAAMLGQLAVVKAMIAARPGVERTLGPHSISLLAHARAGGEQAAEVARYLEALGTAGGLGVEAISEEELEKLTGEYGYGRGANERIAISKKGKQLMFTRSGGEQRPIHHVGGRAFRPAGASGVRVKFEEAALTVRDGDLTLQATRR
ncbi:MAG TPA: hypothetical protein VFB63_20290 [Bryobacteraceae bacterium]|nr:hypothetical protein [Bryobacteraceae bacterium]